MSSNPKKNIIFCRHQMSRVRMTVGSITIDITVESPKAVTFDETTAISMFELPDDEMAKSDSTITCTCGRKMSKSYHEKHLQTDIHKKWLKALTESSGDEEEKPKPEKKKKEKEKQHAEDVNEQPKEKVKPKKKKESEAGPAPKEDDDVLSTLKNKYKGNEYKAKLTELRKKMDAEIAASSSEGEPKEETKPVKSDSEAPKEESDESTSDS